MFSRRRTKKTTKTSYKELLFIIVLLFIAILIFIAFIAIFKQKLDKLNFENEILSIAEANSKTTFFIDKIFLYSNSNAITNETNKPLWNLNIYQYTDIAIYLNNNSNEGLTSENTLQQLYIDNIKYSVTPEKGTPTLYYKNINDFGRPTFNDENIINDKLEFTVQDSNSEIDYSKPCLYTNCSTPISLEFVNKDIKTNAIISNDNPLVFDGSLLKRSNITLNSIATSISFNINIINNLNELFICNVNINIPLENTDTNETIYNGSIKKEFNNLTNYNFYKVNK